MAIMGSPPSSGLLRPGLDNRTKTVRDGWRYEFRVWEPVWQEKATHLVKSIDRSEPYEMNRAHVFRLESGKYVLTTESGCSCYESSDAQHDYFPTREKAIAAIQKWDIDRRP